MSRMREEILSKKLDMVVDALLERTKDGRFKWTRWRVGSYPFEYMYPVSHATGYSVHVAMDNRGVWPRYILTLWNGPNRVYEVAHSAGEETDHLDDRVEELFTEVQLTDPEVMATLDRVMGDINKAIEENKRQE